MLLTSRNRPKHFYQWENTKKCANFWIRFEQTQTPNYESMIAMSYSNGVKNFCTSFLMHIFSKEKLWICSLWCNKTFKKTPKNVQIPGLDSHKQSHCIRLMIATSFLMHIFSKEKLWIRSLWCNKTFKKTPNFFFKFLDWIHTNTSQSPYKRSMIATSYSNGVKNFCTSFMMHLFS